MSRVISFGESTSNRILELLAVIAPDKRSRAAALIRAYRTCVFARLANTSAEAKQEVHAEYQNALRELLEELDLEPIHVEPQPKVEIRRFARALAEGGGQ